jgi:hypothetical protein
VRVVDLADEFGLTTAETIDACLWAGVAADGASAELTMDEVARVRELMGGWNEAGFAPWRGAAPDGARPSPSGAPTPGPRRAGPVAVPDLPTDEPGSAGAGADDAAEAGRPGGADDVDDDFAQRADRLRRREPIGDGPTAVAPGRASRPAPDLEPGASQPDRPATTFPEPGSTGGGNGRGAAAGLPSRAVARAANGSPAAPQAQPAPPVADRAVAPAPPASPTPTPTPSPSPTPVGAAVAAGTATATATAATATATTATATATATEEPPSLRVGGADDAPDDDFGPNGPDAEVVGSSESVPTFNAAYPPVQGGPTGWLPGGPKAKPHLAPLAIIALALAIASLAIPFVPAVIAIVLASVTKDRIDRSRGWLTGKPLATAAQVVAGIGVGLWLVLIVGSIAIQDHNSTPQVADLQVDQGLIAYSDAQAGDCVRLPAIGTVDEWHRVSCTDPHQAEVVGTLVAGNPKSQNYPGAAPIEATAKDGCLQQLANYAGSSAADTKRLEVGYAYPSANTWKNDTDRTIYCLAFRHDGVLLSGTIKLSPSTTLAPDANNN